MEEAEDSGGLKSHQARMPKSPAKALEPKPAPMQPKSGSSEIIMAPRSTRNSFSTFLNALAALFMLSLLGIAAGLFYGKYRFEESGPLSQTATVNIKPGIGVSAIAQLLKTGGVIENSYIFRGGTILHDASAKLKAGEYAFEPGISMRGVMEKMTKGQSVQHKVTIPEGLTSEQIMARIEADPVLLGKTPKNPGEGKLLPETYAFTRGLTRKALIKSMVDAQKKLLDMIWSKRQPNLPFTTREEALTLASIVEKETGKAAERPHIAGVFINRLNKGMRLQSDPTIIYGLVGGKGTLGRSIFLSDITKKTPYNTYTIDGLPPGPIANPGEAAIRAVLQPMQTKDLFFVADGTGGHAFAQTLKDHNANVAKWRKLERAKRSAVKKPAVTIKTKTLGEAKKPDLAKDKP